MKVKGIIAAALAVALILPIHTEASSFWNHIGREIGKKIGQKYGPKVPKKKPTPKGPSEWVYIPTSNGIVAIPREEYERKRVNPFNAFGLYYRLTPITNPFRVIAR